jgi:3-hydroxymyristoyl/3-hydroxydecanoyl-(acyl carrier protein) dehydratase
MNPAAQALAAHPWITFARSGDNGDGMLLVMAPPGMAVLRQRGRLAILAELADYLRRQGQGTPRNWRLLVHEPRNLSAPMVEAMLHSPRPTTAECLDEREDAGVWTLSLRLPPDLVHFDGHFPHAPILPGVLQIAWALTLAAPRLGTSRHCRVMEALKFQRLLRPGDEVQLSLRHDGARGKLHFAYRLEGAHCSSGRLSTESAHG